MKVVLACMLCLVALLPAACGGDEGGAGSRVTIDLATQKPFLSLFGAEARDGISAVAAGDVNGDGHQDLIVGAFGADGPDNSRPDAGEAYVVFGPLNTGKAIDLAEAQPDVTIIGADSTDRLGFAVASGDLNGDGIDDILVGALLADGPGNTRDKAGEMYAIFGSPDLSPTIDIAQSHQDLTIFGAGEGDRLGAAMAVGEVNGDGRPDLLVGSFLADGPEDARYQGGEAYLIFGSTSLSGERDMAQGQYDLLLMGAAEGHELGHHLAMGDLNDDGLDDLIVAAFRTDLTEPVRLDAGEVYVFFSSMTLEGERDIASGDQDLTVQAADAGDDLGNVVASGDVNGDGIDDLIIGAPRADGPGNLRPDAGEVHVIFGSSSLSGAFYLSQQQADVTIVGADSGDRLGVFLATADVNGDGIADIIAGAETADGPDNGRENAGEVYVVLGSRELPPTLDLALDPPDGAILGAHAGDRLGNRVSAADWDGDGLAETLAGAPDANGPDGDREAAGEVRIVAVGPRLRE